MTPDDLRAVQAPIKQRYRDQPGSALVTLAAEGLLESGALTCRVETGRALVVAGLHPATGGSGMQVCSGDMLLEALVACAGVTMQAVATAIGVAIRQGSVRAEGDIDFRGTLGVDREVPVGFREIRLTLLFESDATAEQRETLVRLTERYCVVLQTLRGSASLTTTQRSPG